MPGILEKVICRIFLKSQVVIPYNSPGKVNAFEWQREDRGKQSKRGDAPQFSDPITMQQGSDLEISHKGRNPVLDGFGLIAFASLTPMIFVQFYEVIFRPAMKCSRKFVLTV